jgi:hypothetical protein
MSSLCRASVTVHGVPARVTKALMPQSGVIRSRAGPLISNEGSELTRKGLKVRELIMHDEDEAPVLISGRRLANGKIMEPDLVPLAEVLLRDDARSAALDNVWGMSSPDVDPAGVAILIG